MDSTGTSSTQFAAVGVLVGDDVVVATIAFGMGVEQGRRAHRGADLSSRLAWRRITRRSGARAAMASLLLALMLLFSFADRRTHEFFFERDYPARERARARVHSSSLAKRPFRASRSHACSSWRSPR